MAEKLAPVTITLEDSVTYNNKNYGSITFSRKMIGEDMLASDAVQGKQRKEFATIASMASVPLPVITGLSIDDLTNVLEAAVPFMGKRAQQMVEKAQQAQEAKMTQIAENSLT